MSGGSQRCRLACALLEQETIARARIVARIRVHGSSFEKLLENGCLSCLQLQLFQKQFEKTWDSINTKERIKTALMMIY